MIDIKKDDEIELDITDLNNLGNGVGRYPDAEGLVVFVRGAIGGERVRAKVIKVTASFAVARLVKILVLSPNRAEKDICSAPLSCGGCVYRHIKYEHELKVKQEYVSSAFKKVGLSDIEVLPVLSTGRICGYRNKGQYPVMMTKSGMKAGFYASRTHNIIPANNCSIQNEAFEKIISFVCDFANSHGWSAYDEESGRGLLRHIYLRVGEKTDEYMLCLVINGDSLPYEEKLIGAIKEKFSHIVSFFVNKNTRNTNVVLGKDYRLLYGKGGIEDELCGLRFYITPDSFYQVNRDGAELLYKTAAEMAELSGEELLFDLYCGTGTIGLSMAHKARELYGIEIVESAVKCARENAERNGIKNAHFLCADAGKSENILTLSGGRIPDVVVIDPPRKGSTRELIDCLAELNVKKIVYVSCDPDTLARDCAYFGEKGYTMGQVQPVDMFPKTGHIECVVCLNRNI